MVYNDVKAVCKKKKSKTGMDTYLIIENVNTIAKHWKKACQLQNSINVDSVLT